MAKYTQNILEKEGEDNRLKLVSEIAKLVDAGIDVPPSLTAASKSRQLSVGTMTEAVIELTSRMLANESAISSLSARISALEAFHP